MFSVVDRTFTCRQIGIGSFDETGDFDDISLSSNDAGCHPAGIAAPRQHWPGGQAQRPLEFEITPTKEQP